MSVEHTESNAPAAEPANSLAADPELLGEFVVEAREHLAGIEIQALALDQNPDNTDAIHTMFRGFHTIKGLAGFLDFGAMQAVSHEVETILDMARNAQLRITPAIIDGILESKDFLQAWVASIDSASDGGARLPGPDPQALLVRIQSLSQALPSASPPVKVDATGIDNAETQNPEIPNLEIQNPEIKNPEIDDAESASASTAGLAELTRAITADAAIAAEAVPEPAAAPAASQEAPPPGPRRKDIALVKVQTTKLDYLVDMMGEMVITQSLIRHDPDLAAEGKPRLARNLSQLARITDEVQRTAMSMRMVPVGQLFHKMSRLVRDLAQKNGKAVELVLAGEDTELDRNIVEELADPLMHMVRNALDHGLESREARVKAGKSETGRVTLRAGHQSGHIVIDIADDGRGLDREKILRKAIDRGLTPAGVALTDTDVFNFIFHPGFSTADQVTDVSGRGVGMDVVKKHIQKLRGRVEIHSTPGAGTQFQLKLPLTLAIIDALVAGVGSERYIIPMYAVREMLRPGPDMISTVQGRAEMALVRGALLPIVRLHQCFQVAPRSTDPCECLLIVAENGAKRFCLMVDELIGKQEVVIKSLGEKFQHVQGVAGGAILGDGRVGLILDLERLFGGNSGGGTGE